MVLGINFKAKQKLWTFKSTDIENLREAYWRGSFIAVEAHGLIWGQSPGRCVEDSGASFTSFYGLLIAVVAYATWDINERMGSVIDFGWEENPVVTYGDVFITCNETVSQLTFLKLPVPVPTTCMWSRTRRNTAVSFFMNPRLFPSLLSAMNVTNSSFPWSKL